MKHLFIINPVSGKGRTLEYIPIIQKVFEKRNDLYFIEVTTRPGHATEIVKRYISTDNFRVYSVGGDGTLNEVLNGLEGSDCSLAVIPGGTGNDFIKSVVSEHSFEDIISRTVNGATKGIDIAKANGKHFINIASVGFDAEVVRYSRKFHSIPGIRGIIAYILAVVIAVFKYKSKTLEISIDGKQISAKTLLIAIANGRYYGGGMMPAPEALLDDGWLDICLIKGVNMFKIFAYLPKMIMGKHGTIEEVSFYKGKKIEIACEKEIPLNVDGEVSKVRNAVFEIIPKRIEIVIPEEKNGD